MCLFVDSLTRVKKLLSRVAIGDNYCRKDCCVEDHISGPNTRCSYLRESNIPTNLNHSANIHYLMDRNCTFHIKFGLNPLHSFLFDKLPGVQNGWRGLQDIFICVQDLPQVDEKTTFRPARYNSAHDQRRDRQTLRSIDEIRLGQSQFDHWTAHSQPKFHVVRLSKRAEHGKVYDYLALMRSHNTLSE